MTEGRSGHSPAAFQLIHSVMLALAILPLADLRPVMAAAIQDPNPSECEIQAALLGRTAPGCPSMNLRRPPPDIPAEVAAPPMRPVTRPDTPRPPDAPDVRLSGNFRIQFDFNAATIRSESRKVLDQIGAVLAAPDAAHLRFEVVGHTDAVGSPLVNLRLSKRRAEAVVAYLVARHAIAPERLQAVGMGAGQPLFPDDPKAPANRRVEIVNLGAVRP